MAFKVGDKVIKVVDSAGDMPVGSEHTIAWVSPNGGSVSVEEDHIAGWGNQLRTRYA